MFSVFNHLLVSLCLADMVVLLTNLSLALKTVSPSSSTLSQVASWSDGLCHIAVSGSVFFTIAITVERYYAVHSPLNYQTRSTKQGHWWILASYVVPVVVAAILFNIPKLLQLAGILTVENISPEHQNMFIKVAIISQVIHPLTTTCIIPITILLYLNHSIYTSARRMNVTPRRRDISLENILVNIVAVFIILSLPKMMIALLEVSTIPSILDCYDRQCGYFITSKRWIADIIVRYLVMLNSSTNFLIYCFVGSNFRNTLMVSLRAFLPKTRAPAVNTDSPSLTSNLLRINRTQQPTSSEPVGYLETDL